LAATVVIAIAKYATPLSPRETQMRKQSSAKIEIPKSEPYGKVEADERLFEFGTMQVGTDAERVFTMKNIGDGPLEFQLGTPTCQCTRVEAVKVGRDVFSDGKGVLAPGESVNILIRWTMKERAIQFRHGVSVFTSDPDWRSVDFAVTGNVNTAFLFTPYPKFDLGEMSQSAPTKGEGVLSSQIFDEFTVSEVADGGKTNVSWELLNPEVVKKNDWKGGYKVFVEAGPDVPLGVFSEFIKLKAAHGDVTQEFEIRVVGHRAGPIEIRGAGFNPTNSRLAIANFPANEGKSVDLLLIVKGMDEDLQLMGVEAPDRFRFNLTNGQMLGKSRSYKLLVEIVPAPMANHRGPDADSVTLRFNHPESPVYTMLIDYATTK
jgi:hypothetical protein